MKRSPEPQSASANPLVLTGEGMLWLWATLLLGAIGWWKSINLVLLLAYLMFALLLLNGFLARAHARRVVATRSPAPPAYAGEEASVSVEVSNAGTWGASARVSDPTIDPASSWLVHQLPPAASCACAARRVFPTRGRFKSPVQVSSAYPFGLLQYDRPGEPGAEVVVLPATGYADADGLRRWLMRRVGGDGRARKVLRRVTTDQADVRGVRPYRPGDSIRSIHWRTSARRRELMVREYDAAPSPDLVLVVEPWLPAKPTDADRANLEAALSLAATVVATWSRVYSTRVTVAVAGDPESVRLAAVSDDGTRLALVPLADLAGADSFEALRPQAFDRGLSRSARVVVSSRPNTPYADALIRSTGRPFLALSPADELPWYQPPTPVSDALRKRPEAGAPDAVAKRR